MKRADYEFIVKEEQDDPPVEVSTKEKINVLGLLRLVWGQVRDSAGRPNNILAFLYYYFVFFCVAIYWGTHPSPVTHHVHLYCDSMKSPLRPPTSRGSILSKVKSRLASRLRPPPAKTTIHSSCSGTTIRVTVSPVAPPPLPASYYWVLVIPLCAFLAAYLARRPSIRTFMKNMTLAYKGVKADGEKTEEFIALLRELPQQLKDGLGPTDKKDSS